MALKKTPVKGMCDMLPEDMRLREYVCNMIKETYSSYGFMQIETPVMEHIENLTSKQGGDNEKLIFKVLKRGESLNKALENNTSLADNGLRYDLTVPLARYYSNNKEKLPSPFKALQIGNVFRAENPQKGRFRQFTQCDIDILGDETNLAETELILATAKMLEKILKPAGIESFTVRINDRRILCGAALTAGFNEEDIPSVLISLDKYDKIGLEGIERELLEKGFDSNAVKTYLRFYESGENTDPESFCAGVSPEYLADDIVKSVSEIMLCVKSMIGDKIKFIFDPTLVRGMGYYTGAIFEIGIDGYGFSVAGGGRYDKMIGKFIGQDVPACGFSIGFERIITILKEKMNSKVKVCEKNLAIIIAKGLSVEERNKIFARAEKLRAAGTTVVIQPMKKNLKQQIKMLENEGFSNFEKVYND